MDDMKCRKLGLLRLGSLVAIAVLAFQAAPAQAAVDTLGFELDGNIKNDPGTGVDWADLFNANYPAAGATAKSPLPAGFSAATFVDDFKKGANGPDTTTFTQGSKDILNVDQWVCASANNTGDKVDIVNIYATALQIGTGASAQTILYFALERYANEGDTNLAFWFLQNGTVDCTSPGDFTGAHADGDLLVVSEVTSGGDISAIKVYEWEGDNPGALNTTPKYTGAECDGDPTDVVCGRVNPNFTIDGSGPGTDIPWLTETKQPGGISNDLGPVQFFEAGLNLTAGGLSGCFTKVLGDTRQSPGGQNTSLTAALADYALGAFNLCSISVAKSCQCAAVVDDPNSSDPTDVLFRQVVDATITNTGAGAIPANAITCTDAFDGDPGSPAELEFVIPVALGAQGSATASTTLSASFTAAQRSMLTSHNPPDNSITCTANAFGATFGDSDEGVTCGACAPAPGIFLSKKCVTRLVPESGVAAVKVYFNGTLCNTGDVPADATVKEKHGNVEQTLTLDPAVLDAGVPCDTDAQCSGVVGDDTQHAAACIGDGPATLDGVCFDGGGEGLFFGGDVCTTPEGDYLPTISQEVCAEDASFADDLNATLDYDDDTGVADATATASDTCEVCPGDCEDL